MKKSSGENPFKERTYYYFSNEIETRENYAFEEIASLSSESSYAIVGRDDHFVKKISSIIKDELSKRKNFNIFRYMHRNM